MNSGKTSEVLPKFEFGGTILDSLCTLWWMFWWSFRQLTCPADMLFIAWGQTSKHHVNSFHDEDCWGLNICFLPVKEIWGTPLVWCGKQCGAPHQNQYTAAKLLGNTEAWCKSNKDCCHQKKYAHHFNYSVLKTVKYCTIALILCPL